MTIAAILRAKGITVVHVPPHATVAEVARTLAEHGIGAVLVLDAARQVLGIVSERDVLRCLARHGAEILDMTAAQLMTTRLVVAGPNTTAMQALNMMSAGRFRHLPVMQDEKLLGIISIGDVVKARLDEQQDEVENLTAYVSGQS